MEYKDTELTKRTSEIVKTRKYGRVPVRDQKVVRQLIVAPILSSHSWNTKDIYDFKQFILILVSQFNFFLIVSFFLNCET